MPRRAARAASRFTGNSESVTPSRLTASTFSSGVVVVARHADPVVPAGLGQMLHPPPIDLAAGLQPPLDERIDMLLGQTAGLGVIGPEVGDIGELALARGVVHDGEEMDQPAADQALDFGEGLVVGDLVAGMDVGAGAEAAFQLMDLADQKVRSSPRCETAGSRRCAENTGSGKWR
jgi:hypothetical protein